MVRAEGLFRRFERTVQAVDKKDIFPAPKNEVLRQRKLDSPSGGKRLGELDIPPPGAKKSSPNSKASSTTLGNSSANDSRVGAAVPQGIGAETEKVISPELRLLLSREIIELDKLKEGADGGEASRTRASGLRD